MDPEATDPRTHLASPSDGELVRRAQNGQRPAYDELIRRHQRQAVAVSYRLLGNVHDALEVTQDAYLKGFTSLGTLQNPEAFAGWLMRIVANLSLNYRRGRKNRPQLPLDDLLCPTTAQGNEPAGSQWMARGEEPASSLVSREMGGKLQEALAKLPERQRLALIMFSIEELPQKQVAEALGCSVEAVKWHVFQGRKKLKEMMKDYM